MFSSNFAAGQDKAEHQHITESTFSATTPPRVIRRQVPGKRERHVRHRTMNTIFHSPTCNSTGVYSHFMYICAIQPTPLIPARPHNPNPLPRLLFLRTILHLARCSLGDDNKELTRDQPLAKPGFLIHMKPAVAGKAGSYVGSNLI